MTDDNDMYETSVTRGEIIFGCGIACAVILPILFLMMYFN